MLSLLAAVALSQSPVAVESLCVVDAAQVFIHVLLRTEWQRKGEAAEHTTRLVHLSCDRQTSSCTGALVSMDSLVEKNSKPVLGPFDVRAIVDAKLVSAVGGVAVVAWGVHQFVLDVAASSVTASATSLDGTLERGVAKCQTVKK